MRSFDSIDRVSVVMDPLVPNLCEVQKPRVRIFDHFPDLGQCTGNLYQIFCMCISIYMCVYIYIS